MAAIDSQPFAELTTLLDSKPQAFGLAEGDASLATAAENALRHVFKLALASEATSIPHITNLLNSFEAPDPSDESKAVDFEPTPLTELYTDGMEPEQIWEQLEMRTAKICDLLEEAGMLDMLAADGSDAGSLTAEEKAARGIEEYDSEEDEFAGEFDSFDGIDDMEDSGDSEDDDEDDSEEEGDEDENDDEGMSLMDGEEGMSGDEESDEGMYDDEDMEDEEDENSDEDDDTSRRIHDLDASGGSASSSKRSHPTLDDPFFSIHEFNRETEELEALQVTSGKLGKDDDEDDDFDDEMDDDDLLGNLGSGKGVDMWRSVEGDGQGGTDEVKYAEFFAPPAKVPKPATSAGTSSKKGKGKARAIPIEEEDMDENMDMDGFDEEDEEEEDDDDDDLFDPTTGETTTRKTDLFAEDVSEDGEESAPLSSHAARIATLSKQIATLEAENVAPKPWALSGEASSRSRPINAILEEDLEFENVSKQVPVVTEERVKGLEDKIKQRILNNDFNDVVRRRPIDSKPYLPSKFFELQDTQSTKSLAQLYEDDYTVSSAVAAGGAAPIDDRDGRLQKEHDEIEKAWNEICYKLDALSNANFTPKQPKAQIQTMSNLPSLSLETALPPTQRATTQLAPEEVFAPPQAGELRARSEMTPAEKRTQRSKDKKVNRRTKERITKAEEAKKRAGKGRRVGRDEALRGLVKEGRGVTIIGKDAKKFDPKGRRQEGVAGPSQSGVGLKL